MNALVICKKSAYELYFKKLKHSSKDPVIVSNIENLKSAHEAHYQCLKTVLDALKLRKMHANVIIRGKRANHRSVDLIISVGGDGTFLDACKLGLKAPILAVNSDPRHSVGRYCCCNESSFSKTLDEVISKKQSVRQLSCLELLIDSKVTDPIIVNDVLFCHPNPAAMTHYLIADKKKFERQRSSGVWVSTATGSSGAIFSAGGKKVAPKKKCFEFLPRELYEGNRFSYHIRGGMMTSEHSLRIQSLMPEACVYIDGAHHFRCIEYGQSIKIRLSQKTIKVFT